MHSSYKLLQGAFVDNVHSLPLEQENREKHSPCYNREAPYPYIIMKLLRLGAWPAPVAAVLCLARSVRGGGAPGEMLLGCLALLPGASSVGFLECSSPYVPTSKACTTSAIFFPLFHHLLLFFIYLISEVKIQSSNILQYQ